MTKTETFAVVDQAAYDEPIYESHQVCKVCGKDFGKGENATVEAINHSVVELMLPQLYYLHM